MPTNRLQPVAPQAVIDIIRQQMLQIAQGENAGLLSIGLLGAIWSSSAALVAVVGALNKAYDLEESRPWWKVRLTAIVLTIALAVFTGLPVSFAEYQTKRPSSSVVVLTWSLLAGFVVPIPTLPAESITIRSVPIVVVIFAAV